MVSGQRVVHHVRTSSAWALLKTSQLSGSARIKEEILQTHDSITTILVQADGMQSEFR
jgi:hypothetical protein